MSVRSGFLGLGLIAAAVTALAGSATAFAHGHAHAELVEHASAHHAPAGDAAVGAGDDHHGHAHTDVDPGMCSRVAIVLAVMPTGRAALEPVPLTVFPEGVPPGATESPPDPPDGSPNRPRPPPVSA